jgi:hypothetical protein
MSHQLLLHPHYLQALKFLPALLLLQQPKQQLPSQLPLLLHDVVDPDLGAHLLLLLLLLLLLQQHLTPLQHLLLLPLLWFQCEQQIGWMLMRQLMQLVLRPLTEPLQQQLPSMLRLLLLAQQTLP